MSSQALFLFRRLSTFREKNTRACSCSSFRLQIRSFSQAAHFHKTQCGLYIDKSLPPTFDKILIANRGEIACRVIRTCRQVGIKTVAVYSDADANSMHTQMADESYRIGEAPAASSYLRMDKILEVAKHTGAQAIHPGYGFLSENETFARKCEEARVKFIGPPPKAINAMGSKSASKEIMIKAGVPVVPGYHGEDQSVATLKAEAKRVGYPVMLKAVHGGGGKGMRIVFKPEDFEDALESCKRESKASFGNDSVLVERYIQRPRHIEFQIFADQHNNAVHLYERDCSVQRRHQKVLEEAPAPGMLAELRAKMGKSAVDAALAVGYEGAGTVEFIFDAETDEYFFMEMNTRLQVEHPVTEMVMKRDLVQWQLHVAHGNKLPAKQEDLTALGHALEARIYAENPDNNFLPATGRLVHLYAPALSPDLRVETGVREGDEVSIFYDPMISKLVVWGPNRIQCIRRMQQALENYRVVGPPTNIPFLRRAVAHPEFQKGKVETGFIAKNLPVLLGQTGQVDSLPQNHFAAAGIFQLLLNEKRVAKEKQKAAYDPSSPWSFLDNFRVNSEEPRPVTLFPAKKGKEEKQEQIHVKVKTLGHATCGTRGDYSFEFADGSKVRVTGSFNPTDTSKSNLLLTVDDRAYRADVVRDDLKLHVFVNGEQASFSLPEVVYGTTASGSGGLACVAPMAGKVVKVMVKANDNVQKGTPLMIMEAMKMETVIQAEAPGVVEAVHFQPGDFVEGGKVVISFAKSKGEKEKTK